MPRSISQRHNLRVRCWIASADRMVVPAPDDKPVVDDYRTDSTSPPPRLLGKLERDAHEHCVRADSLLIPYDYFIKLGSNSDRCRRSGLPRLPQSLCGRPQCAAGYRGDFEVCAGRKDSPSAPPSLRPTSVFPLDRYSSNGKIDDHVTVTPECSVVGRFDHRQGTI